MDCKSVKLTRTATTLLNNGKIRTPEGFASYPNLFKSTVYVDPVTKIQKGDPSWGCDIVFPSYVDIEPLKAAFKDAAMTKFGTLDGIAFTLRSVDKIKKEKKRLALIEAFGEGCYVLKLKRPDTGKMGPIPVKDITGQDLQEKDMYGGCVIQAVITLRPYVSGDNEGVAVNVVGIQKTKDGIRLGGSSLADDDFEYAAPMDNDFEDAPF